ncbi:hypothetical protein Sfulv_41260 [Streptomyces fulvorobeus]|uniref:Uncharacterized protein n=1 Tax=Streptomyces fulvorobeus TaxID=284028 RepID=A0A7J0C9U4_9ACTN|nr:hypothetical protein Sfulv_41260 [Streptomyces fulvorobeus]
MVAALTSGTPAAAELAALYKGPMTTPGEVSRAADAVDRAGGRDWAQVCAGDRMARAVHHLSRAVPDLASAGTCWPSPSSSPAATTDLPRTATPANPRIPHDG